MVKFEAVEDEQEVILEEIPKKETPSKVMERLIKSQTVLQVMESMAEYLKDKKITDYQAIHKAITVKSNNTNYLRSKIRTVITILKEIGVIK